MVIDYARVMKWPFAPLTESYSRKDCIGFALACGAGQPGPLQSEDARFIVDGSALRALPMLAVMLNQGPMWTKDPATGIDWTKTVHAEETIVMHRPLPVEGTLTARYEVDEIYDKGAGKGALMYESKHLDDSGGAPVATVHVATFLRGDGGFGGGAEGQPPAPHAVPQDRPPDASVDLATAKEPDDLYKLASEFVAAVGLAVPPGQAMLRGVCAFGVAGRGAMALACGNDPSRLRALGLRYAGPIFTGETVRIELWRDAPGQASFQMRAIERGVVVLKNGYIRHS